MSEGRLKAAVLGLNEKGRLLLEAAGKLDYFEIIAVADKDGSLAEEVAGQYKCAAYDDYRQLVTMMDSRLRGDEERSGEDREGGDDRKGGDDIEDGDGRENDEDRESIGKAGCLLVAAPMHTCDEYVRMAARKKINILKMAPLARNFEEAAELVRLAEEQDIKLAIGNPGRFAKSFLALRDFIQEVKIEQVFLITAYFNAGDREHPPWQTDPKLAGGGVLLHNCYQIIDQIILNFSTPEQIYSLNTNAAGDRQQRLYLTEDTAVVTMKFRDVCFGNLIASRRSGAGASEEYLKIYGKDKILTVSNTQLIIMDGTGKKKKMKYDDDGASQYRAMLENFALSILSPRENSLSSSGRENLTNMAVIESAYLSARTAVPEEPGKILQMAPTEREED
jgi:predicted dehydrogenase